MEKTLYKTNEIETIEVRISETQHPQTFGKLVRNYVRNGMSEEEARNYVRGLSFSMEVYFEEDAGLFLVESEACESTPIYSPYTRDEFIDTEF